jgi:hypothetical protein
MKKKIEQNLQENNRILQKRSCHSGRKRDYYGRKRIREKLRRRFKNNKQQKKYWSSYKENKNRLIISEYQDGFVL